MKARLFSEEHRPEELEKRINQFLAEGGDAVNIRHVFLSTSKYRIEVLIMYDVIEPDFFEGTRHLGK